jgi:Tfp pilus assembly protein PilN
MRAVNLLPRDLQTRKSFRDEDPAVVVGSALAVVVLIALLAGFVSAHSHAMAEQHQLQSARAALGRISEQRSNAEPKPVKHKKPVKIFPIVPVPAVTAELQPRLDALSSALESRVSWDTLLGDFSLVIPSDVTINSLAMSAPSPTTAAAGPGQSFSLGGTAYSHDSVARLLARLMLMPELDNVELTNSSANATGEVSFQIDAEIKGTATSAAPSTATTTTTTTTTTSTGATS